MCDFTRRRWAGQQVLKHLAKVAAERKAHVEKVEPTEDAGSARCPQSPTGDLQDAPAEVAAASSSKPHATDESEMPVDPKTLQPGADGDAKPAQPELDKEDPPGPRQEPAPPVPDPFPHQGRV